MEGLSGSDILQLAQLLKQGDPEDDFEDNQKVKKQIKNPKNAKPKIVRKENEDDVDTQEKLDTLLSSENETNDWRKVPQWNLIYKQAVTPSDIYLQMSAKTQLTSSCEEMVIVVELPGEKAPNIDVKIKRDNLELLSPQFRLFMPLPHPVDPQKGNAKWDSYKEALILTLVMEREFDFINF